MTATRAAMRSFCTLLHTPDRLFLYPQTTPPGIRRKAHDKAFFEQQGTNKAHSDQDSERREQIKPRYNRHFRRCIVAFLVVGVARLELAASCSQSRRATNCATPRKNEYYHTIPFFCAFVKCAECRNLLMAPKTTLTLYFCLEAEPKMVYYKVY